MCLVEIEKNPKLAASCAMPVAPGMRVITASGPRRPAPGQGGLVGAAGPAAVGSARRARGGGGGVPPRGAGGSAGRGPPPPPPPPLPSQHQLLHGASHDLHRPRDRPRDASAERDPGARSVRHGLHMPLLQRGEWRAASRAPQRMPAASPAAPSAGPGAVSRALSMSPGPYHHAAAAAASGGAPRRTGLGPGGSRGGSPSRK
ncbi:hypothetical protein GGI00_006754 [Coemansia sp. RSA 2681]|nr:hypothetical protein GGI00_006754 [Coemansia sp. RSA 2681]